MNTFIYCIKNKDGEPVYVGQTIRGKQRFTNHVSDAKCVLTKNQPIVMFLRACFESGDAYSFEIIEHVEPGMLDDREAFWIGEMLKQNKPLLNQTLGGLTASRICDPWNKNAVGLQAAWNKGLPSDAKGIPRTEEVKVKISEAHKGKKQHYFYKKVVGRNRTSGLELGFPSITHAALFIDTDSSNVCKVLKGKKKSYKDWVFSYVLGGVG